LAAPRLGRTQTLIRTSFGPTTTDISTGHAGHSSIPQAMGYWREEGLDVNVFGIAGSIVGVQLLLAGNIDFMSLNGEETLAARARGIPLKGVYTHARTSISRIVVPKNSPAQSLVDLKGKTVGLPVIDGATYASAAFKEVGIDMAKDIRLVATGTGAPALLALRRGDIAAWISWDTAVAALENRGMEFREFRPSYFNELIGNVVVTREQLIRDNPDLVVKMCRGIAKSVHFGLANPEAAIRIHWKTYPATRPQGGDEAQLLTEARRIFTSRFQSYALIGTDQYGMNLAPQWARTAALMRDQGQLAPDADLPSAYTNDHIPPINAWDRAAVAAQAVAWRG
jgi:NitT/TauT family transport system substrate-binding protein